MKLKQKLLLAVIATAFAAPAFADTAGDTQDVSIEIPEVKLLDVKNASGTTTVANQDSPVTFTWTLADLKDASDGAAGNQIAGNNFIAKSKDIYYDITANILAASTKSKITVSADTIAATGLKATFTPATAVGGGTTTPAIVTADTTPTSVVENIGNVASKDNVIVLSLEPADLAVVPSVNAGSAKAFTLTYTLASM